MKPDDFIAIGTFNTEAAVKIPLQQVKLIDKEKFTKTISSIKADGGTNF